MLDILMVNGSTCELSELLQKLKAKMRETVSLTEIHIVGIKMNRQA